MYSQSKKLCYDKENPAHKAGFSVSMHMRSEKF